LRRYEKAIIAFALVAVLGVSSFIIYTSSFRKPSLVIYTYESLLEWGDDPEAVRNFVFGEFERRYGIEIDVRRFEDARSALLKLIEEKENPVADLIIGIDDILAIEAIKEGVLEPYVPSNISLIRSELVEALDPTYHVVPYDFGLIAFVYDTEYVNESSYPEINELKFTTFEDNSSYSKTLIVESPLTSSTGLSFLLWEIAIYEKVLGRDWREWWYSVKDHIDVESSWGDAYYAFLTPSEGRHIVVSYGTDGAYSMYFYNSTRYRATVAYDNGSAIAWLQIEGIGIVKNCPHPGYAKLFVEWFLSNEVQRYFALNNWMYPASSEIDLPEVYQYAINPENVLIANLLISKDEISENLSTWLEEWQTIMVA